MAIILRPALQSDIPRIHALDERLFPPGVALHLEAFALAFVDPDTVILLAETGDGAMAGFIMLTFYGDHELSIESVDVDESFRRQGIGRRLMTAALTVGRERGAKEITLQVAESDQGARAFYRSLGYKETGLTPQFYNGRIDAVEMHLSLDAPLTEG